MDDFNPDKLNNEDYYVKLVERVNQLEFFLNPGEAYKLWRNLKNALPAQEGKILSSLWDGQQTNRPRGIRTRGFNRISLNFNLSAPAQKIKLL